MQRPHPEVTFYALRAILVWHSTHKIDRNAIMLIIYFIKNILISFAAISKRGKYVFQFNKDEACVLFLVTHHQLCFHTCCIIAHRPQRMWTMLKDSDAERCHGNSCSNYCSNAKTTRINLFVVVVCCLVNTAGASDVRGCRLCLFLLLGWKLKKNF